MERYFNISQIPYERKSIERILTGFSDLDYYIKGLEAGITLLVANTNSGKSTFCQGLLSRAIEQGYKAWVFSGEHTERSFLQLLYHQNSRRGDYFPIAYKDYRGRDTNIADWYITETREREVRKRFDGRLFLYSNRADRKIESILGSMQECYDKEGARFFLIDNMISIDNISSNVFAEQTRITEKIRTFALNNNVMVLLVAHQRKLSDKGFRIDIQDVSGSQNISNKAYNVLAQYRVDMLSDESKEYERLRSDLAKSGFDLSKCDNVIEVLKTKGNGNGLIGLKYDAETKTYYQAEKISPTQADKIIHSVSGYQQSIELSEVADDEDIPF